MAGYSSAGMLTREVTRDYLLCLPVLLPAILLGRAINHRLSAGEFSRYIYGGLAIIGLALIIQSLVRFG